MQRRRALGLICAGAIGLGQPREIHVRGKLAQHKEGAPTLEPMGGKAVELDGDKETLAVLNDPRLAGMDFEVLGEYVGPGRFRIAPFTTPGAVLVHKDGKRYTISYWCEICSIRAYTPGKCQCCQRETELSLQEYTP
jgi:hypothetical protein